LLKVSSIELLRKVSVGSALASRSSKELLVAILIGGR
jgi:hypothetical protein